MINWVLQKNLTKAEVLDRIKSALDSTYCSWEEIEVIPFSESIPRPTNPGRIHIPYGSTTFMLNAYKNDVLRKGVFFSPQTFRMSHYVSQWQENVLNADGKQIRFGALKDWISAADTRWFVRPDDDGKGFAGRVATYRELLEWSKKVVDLDIPELNAETKIWISSPKKIEKEWRLFIVNDEVVSASRYMSQGQLNESNTDIPPAMIRYAESLASAYPLEEVYTMDIAISDGQYKLIECNCFNGTGFYAHNIEKVVSSINAHLSLKLKNDLHDQGGKI